MVRDGGCCVLILFSESEWGSISFFSLFYFVLKARKSHVYLVIFFSDSVLVCVGCWCVGECVCVCVCVCIFVYEVCLAIYIILLNFHFLYFSREFLWLLIFSRNFPYLLDFSKMFPSHKITLLFFFFFFCNYYF